MVKRFSIWLPDLTYSAQGGSPPLFTRLRARADTQPSVLVMRSAFRKNGSVRTLRLAPMQLLA